MFLRKEIRNIFLKLALFFALLVSPFAMTPYSFLGCSAETGPLSVPVPYTGTLQDVTTVVFDDGVAVEFCDTFGHPAGCLWNLFDTEGSLIGTYQTHNETIDNFADDGQTISFSMETTHCTDCGEDLDLDGNVCGDGDEVCFHSANNLAAFRIVEEDPPLDIRLCEGAEAGSQVLPLSGWAQGIILDDPRTTGVFQDQIGCLVHYRSVFEAHQFPDGFIAFCKTNGCSWFVECPD